MLLIVFPAMAIATLIGTILLGRLAENWFLAFGMVLVVLASAVSVAQALRNAWMAKRAKHVVFDDYLPKGEEKRSHMFRYAGGLTGINTLKPLDQLAKDIHETRRQIDQDIERLEVLHLANHHRINSCLAQIRYHEDATLPKILGQGTGHIIAAAVFSIWGSIYLAFPGQVYEWAQHSYAVATGWVS